MKLAYLGCINDAHVHASLAGMMQEGRVEGPPHSLVAPEREGHVGNPATNLAARADMFDDLGSPDEVHCIVVVLLHARADSQDVGVENNVLRVEANLLHHYLVRPLAYPDLHIRDNCELCRKGHYKSS